MVTRIAKLVTEKVRAEDSVARMAQATFVVLAANTAAAHMVALADRLRRELDEARVTYREQPLKFVTSIGVASISADPAGSIEELVRLAMQRLQAAAAAAAGAAQPRASRTTSSACCATWRTSTPRGWATPPSSSPSA